MKVKRGGKLMEEKRKQRRYQAEIRLTIETLYKQDNVNTGEIDQDIVITDISRTGIGFICDADLPLDYYFNARIDVGENKHFYAVVKIIRRDDTCGGSIHYGCEFVGLADVLSIFVEDYGSKFGKE